MNLDPDAMYIWYVDYAAVRADTFKQSIGVIVGPFDDEESLRNWLIAVSAPHRTQYDLSHQTVIERYETTLVKHDVLYSLQDGEHTQQYAPAQSHVLTPDAALLTMSNVINILKLFATAPVTLWDMMTDTQESINE